MSEIRKGVIMAVIDRQTLAEGFSCGDLPECGKRVAAFAQMALDSVHRDMLVQIYYDWIIAIHKEDLIFNTGEPHYKIFSGGQAALRYLAHNSPARCGTVRTLRRLNDLGISMSREFYHAQGQQVEAANIRQAMGYLNEEFGLDKKIFDLHRPCFIRLGQSHTTEQDHWRIIQTDMSSSISIYFYPCCINIEEPIHRLFRQLAGICYNRFRSEKRDLSRSIEDDIKSWCCPEVDLLTERRQKEMIVEGICLGLIHGSPFEDGNLPNNVKTRRRRIKMLIQQTLHRL